MEDFSEHLKLINNCNPEDPLLSSTVLGLRLNQIPLDHVNTPDFTDLTQALNLEQLIPTDSGLARDYRGLAELMGYTQTETETRFKRLYNPTKGLIDAFISKNLTIRGNCQVTLNDLLKLIERIERFDVIDDFMPTLVKLASTYDRPSHHHLQQQEARQPLKSGSSFPNSNTSTHDVDNPILVKDFNLLTVDETPYSEIRYHAFICYAPEDIEYAQQLTSLLEQCGKRVATADDLLPGDFEHDALIKMIDSRCKKVIIILTPNFSRSKECEFQTKFANELGIKDNSPKIIPVLFEFCKDSELPSMVRVLSKIDMTSHGRYHWMQVQRLIRSLSLNPAESIRDARNNYLPALEHISQHQITHSKASSMHANAAIDEPQNSTPSVMAYINDNSHATKSSITNGGPMVELLQSQNSSEIEINFQSVNSNLSSQASLGKPTSSSNPSSSRPMIWFKSFKKKMLGDSASVEPMSANNSLQALLLTSSSRGCPDDENSI